MFLLPGLPLIHSNMIFSNISAKEFPSNMSWINKRVLAILHEGISRWMFVHPTNTAVILDLKGFLINQLFLSTSEYHFYYQGGKRNMPFSEIVIIILSIKLFGSFEAAAISLTNLFFPPSRFSLLSSNHSQCCLPHLVQQLQEKNEQQKNSLCFKRNAKH